jgi:DNA-binding NtrC family response regulator
LTAEAVERLLQYPWPGNVRELENALERTAILVRSARIGPADLPAHIAAGTPLGPPRALPRAHTLAEVEKTHILQTLERCGWQYARAAEMLGIGRTTLWRKLKEHQLDEGARPPSR